MKTCTLVLAVAGLVPLVLAQPAKTDFRKTTWGMSPAQVMATESPQPSEVRESNGDGIVRYDSIKLAGMDARLVYIFAKDRLVRAKYLFDAEHSDPNEFIGDFKTVESLLMDQYGKPASDRAIWEDDSLQEEPKTYLDQDRASATGLFQSDRFVGLAVSLGHLKLFTSRGETRTTILHSLTGENHRILHQIEYRNVR